MSALGNSNPENIEYLKNCNFPTNNSIFLTPATESEVVNCILSLKDSSSPDVYDICAKPIKRISSFISKPLAFLNKCIDQGVFPKCLKIAKVIALYKKGECDDINNFRPIAVLPVLSKVFEMVLKNRLLNFFESNNLFADEQFGFRKHKSTSKAVLSIVNYILENLDIGHITCASLIDLSKAFDCVNHSLLLEKLYFYGVRGISHDLLRSYLSDRFQSVYEKENMSDRKQINIGVPQRSILGPLLFLIFINDLPKNSGANKAVLFADDTTLLNHSSNVNELISLEKDSLDQLKKWLSSNRLLMNKDKTQSIAFSLNSEVNWAYNVKCLGFTLDRKLTWQCHVEILAKKLNIRIFQLRKLVTYCSFSAAKIFYHSNVHSLICYGLILWGSSTHATRIFALQKRAIRILCKTHDQRTHCRPLFKKLKILSLPSLYIYTSDSLTCTRKSSNVCKKCGRP